MMSDAHGQTKLRVVAVLLGPKLEEDQVGELRLDAEAFVRAIPPTWMGYFDGAPKDRERYEVVARQLAELLLLNCEAALADWLRAYVRWELIAAATTADEFLDLLRNQPPDRWEPCLLSAPAVQKHITTLRRDSKGADREFLGRWFKGTPKRGRPQSLDHKNVSVRTQVTRKHLRRFASNETLRDSRNPAAAFTPKIAAEHRAVVERLRKAGLLAELLRDFGSPDFVEEFSNRLVASEEQSTPESVRRIARLKRSRAPKR